MEGLPGWLRVWLTSVVLGASAGVVCGVGLLGFMFVTGGIENGFYSDASAGFVIGFILCVVMGAAVGALVGTIFGFLSGAVAAPTYLVLQRVSGPRVAAAVTVVAVLLLQLVVGLLVVERDVWWTAIIVPTISVVPMMLAVRRAEV